MDDRRLIAKLYEVDPEFSPFMESLGYVSKSGGGAQATGDPAKDKKLAQGALVGTGVATAGGLHALAGTRAEHKVRASEIETGAKQVPKALRALGPKRASAAITGGWLALHGVELAADATNAHTQTKQIRAANAKMGDVSKGLPGHFQPVGLVRANARANQAGQRLRGATYRRPRGAVTPIQKGLVSDLRAVSHGPGLLKHLGSPEHAEQLSEWGTRAARTQRDSAHAEAMSRFDMRRPQPGPTAGGKHRPISGNLKPVGPKHAAPKSGKGLRGNAKPIGLAVAGTAAVGAGAGGAVAAERKRVPQSAPGTKVAKNCEWVGEISKVDTEKRQVFGWASLSMVDGQPVLDRQGDYIAIEDSEDAAYRYMLSSRKGGDMHARISKLDAGPKHTADVIESIVFTPEKIEALGLEPDALPLGWWIGMQVHDEQQWDDIKSGRRTGFSVHGTGVRKDLVTA